MFWIYFPWCFRTCRWCCILNAELSSDAGTGRIREASSGIGDLWGQGRVLRLWVLWCTRHSVRLCRPALLQELLHRRINWLHFWGRTLSLWSKLHDQHMFYQTLNHVTKVMCTSNVWKIYERFPVCCVGDLMRGSRIWHTFMFFTINVVRSRVGN